MRKQVWVIFLLILLSTVLIGCGASQSLETTSTTSSNNEKKPFDVTMDARTVISSDKVQCNLTTNLPNDTKLFILLEDEQMDTVDSTNADVSGGKATATLVVPDSKPGNYRLSIMTSVAQPSSVLSLIGTNGDNMAGSYVRDDIYGGKEVDYDKQIAIGTPQQIKEQKQKVEQQAVVEKKAEADKYKPQKIVDSNGKQIWKVYISTGQLHFTGTYKGTGNFIVKLSDSNQDLVAVIANEIGDFVSDKTVYVHYVGWYYLEVDTTDGSCSYQWS